jgi:hypothetical protein
MKLTLLIATTVAALIPAGAVMAQSTPAPGQSQPGQPSQQSVPGQSPTPGQSTTTPGQPTPSQSGQPVPGQTTTPGQPMPGQSTTPSQRVPGQSTPPPQSSSPATNSTTTRGTFRSIDEDGDGRISRTEASSDDALGRGFAQADANGDGYVDNAEYARSRNSPGQPRQ